MYFSKTVIHPFDSGHLLGKILMHNSLKGDPLAHYMEFPPIIVAHMFAANAKEFICDNEVYVSDSWHPSHYRNVHGLNEGNQPLRYSRTLTNKTNFTGAEQAGKISANMTFLKEKKMIKLQKPSANSKYKGPKAPKHWEVEIQLVMIIEGRNLRFEARWPVPDHNNQHQTVKAKGQISIAAAFQPGTA